MAKMKMPRLPLAVTVLVSLFTLTVSTATAGSLGNGGVARMRLEVVSVDTKAGAVELKSMGDPAVHTYKIDATTRITLSGSPGEKTIDQIKVGQTLINYASASGRPKDGQTLTLIYLRPAASAPAAPAKP